METGKKVGLAAVGGLVGILLTARACGTEKPVQTPVQVQMTPAPTTRPVEGTQYTVVRGDYLSRIMVNELGAKTNKEIYSAVRCTQEATWGAAGSDERDIVYRASDGLLDKGKDGYADVLQIGETLNLCR